MPPPLCLALAVAGTLAGVVLIFVMLWWLLVTSVPADPVPTAADAPSPERLLHDLQEEAHLKLTTYGWVDREAGRLRIPVSEAMRKLVAESTADDE